MKRTTKVAKLSARPATARRSRGRTRDDATFPISSPKAEVPDDYGATLADIKKRILTQRLHVVIAANAAMVKLYWDIGRTILDRQRNAGLGCQGHRPALGRSARSVPRHAGVLAAQPQVHASVCGGLA